MPWGRSVAPTRTMSRKAGKTQRRGHSPAMVRGHRPATEMRSSATLKMTSVGRVPYVGISQKTGRKVPRMLPAVLSA